MSTASQPTNPLSQYTQLSPSIFVQEPLAAPPENEPQKTIILSFWMNAPPRALAKYVLMYRQIAPTARIIFILSSSNDFMIWFTQHAQEKRLAPAIQALLSSSSCTESKDISIDNKNSNPVFIHMFSNGGVFSTIHLLSTYRKTTGQRLRVSSMIIDSAPGTATVDGAVKAMSYSLPKAWILHIFSRFLMRVFLTVGFFLRRLTRVPDSVLVLRRAINSGRLIRGSTASLDDGEGEKGSGEILPRRCYIYSEQDELVDWRDVERHADDAEAKGWKVRREKFEGSEHVAHMRSDPERYWGVVKEYLS